MNKLRFFCVTTSPAERQKGREAPWGNAPACSNNTRCLAAALLQAGHILMLYLRPGACFSSELPDYPPLPHSGWQPGCMRLDVSLLEQNRTMWLGTKPLKPVQYRCWVRSTRGSDCSFVPLVHTACQEATASVRLLVSRRWVNAYLCKGKMTRQASQQGTGIKWVGGPRNQGSS